MNSEKDKDSSVHSEYLTKRNFMKNEKNQIFNLRDTFMNSFNEKREKETALLEMLNSAKFENSQIDSCVDSYNILLKSMTGFPINNKMKEIHKLISIKKESFYSLVINNSKSELHNKNSFKEFLVDIRKNKWIIDEGLLNDITEKANTLL